MYGLYGLKHHKVVFWAWWQTNKRRPTGWTLSKSAHRTVSWADFCKICDTLPLNSSAPFLDLFKQWPNAKLWTLVRSHMFSEWSQECSLDCSLEWSEECSQECSLGCPQECSLKVRETDLDCHFPGLTFALLNLIERPNLVQIYHLCSTAYSL